MANPNDANNSGLNRLYGGGHPPFVVNDDGHPFYDSSAEPEATGRCFEQGHAIRGGKFMAEAQARMTDIGYVQECMNSHEDLLSGAPRRSDDTGESDDAEPYGD